VVAFLGLQKEENAETRMLLLDVLGLFRTGEVNNVARNAAGMLESLLRMEPELKTPRTSMKRLRGEDEDPVEADAQDRALAKVVKRIVVSTCFTHTKATPKKTGLTLFPSRSAQTGRPAALRTSAGTQPAVAAAPVPDSGHPFRANPFSPSSASAPYSEPSPFSFGAALGLGEGGLGGGAIDEGYDPTERYPLQLGFASDFQFLNDLGPRTGAENFLMQYGLGSM